MFPDAGPTARTLLTLEALQARPGITAGQLAERLGVTERAARRSVATLRDVGIPVESTRGPHGGYRLGRGLRLPPMVFSATEALGLVMAVLSGGHPETAGAALDKLVAALPENVARPASLVLEHAAATKKTLTIAPDPTTTAAVVAAVAEQRTVEIGYVTGNRAWRERVDPWAVVVRRGAWYLLCHSHRAEAVRTYRLDRVEDVVECEARFEPPADLDPVAAVTEHLSTGWRHPVRVVLDASLDDARPWLRGTMGALEAADEPGRCILVGSTNNPEAYLAEYLAPLPCGFEIVDGPQLREAAARLAERFRAAAHNRQQVATRGKVSESCSCMDPWHRQ
ncbi:WYL domain-containing protein [Luteococcus sp. H138]|uniref:helix-turn-helix transcriptional regulator n=1 Tax=unclassified Luteococcus TaxID=2639923 RepID=UPI00313C048C